MLANLTPSQFSDELADALHLVGFWRIQTRAAIRAYNAGFVQADRRKRADMLATVSRAFRQYRWAQAKVRQLRTAPELRFFRLVMEGPRYAA